MLIILGFIVNLFDLYILKKIVNSFCRPRLKNTFSVYILICVFSGLFTLIKVSMSSAFTLIFIIVIVFILFSVLYKPINHIALSVIMWVILGQCIDWIVAYTISKTFDIPLFEVYSTSPTYAIIGAFSSMAIKYTVVYFVISKRYSDFIEKTFSLYQYVFFGLSLAVMLNSTLLFNNLIDDKPISKYLYVCFFASVVSLCIYVFFLFDRLILVAKENANNRMISEQNKMNKQLIDEVEIVLEYLKELSHDYNHHLNHLTHIVQSESSEDAQKYVALVIEDYKKLVRYGFINNKPALSLLIMQKIKLAKSKGILFECAVMDVLETNMPNPELNSLLANLLDNAIEATSKLEANKKISLKIHTINDTFFIAVANTFNGQLSDGRDGYITTKKDKYFHGYGLKSVKRIVESRDGNVTIDITADYFKVVVGLPLLCE